MTETEWKQRYKQEFMAAAKLSETDAQDCVDAAKFPAVMEGFEDNPEGAAQEEMSYWEE